MIFWGDNVKLFYEIIIIAYRTYIRYNIPMGAIIFGRGSAMCAP